MTLWSDLYPTRHLISRQYVSTVGATTLTAPYNALVLRASGVGAGGWTSGGFGGGAAFARVKLTNIVAAEQFQIQIGDILHTLGAGSSAGDTTITRVATSAVVLKAARGGTTQGLAANSLGDTVRDGSAYTGSGLTARGGAAAGDDDDPYALGFGGRGGSLFLGPVRGGGGAQGITVGTALGGASVTTSIVPGRGLACIEWFSEDPGY